MIGPVFHQEMMLGSRRSRAYIFRWVYAGWLLLQVGWFYLYWFFSTLVPWSDGPEYATPLVAAWFVEMFLFQQLILLQIATPILVAGAVTEEKTRGTLQYLLTTDLDSWHIVVGKMLGRMTQVVFLMLTGLPLFCFFGVFAGLEPWTLLAAALTTLLPLLALSAASMLASVWFRQTRDAVLWLGFGWNLAFGLLWWLGPRLGHVGGILDPFWVVGPVWGRPGAEGVREFLVRFGWSALCWGGIAVVCLALAVWRLRPAYVRQLEGEGRQRKPRWWRAQRAPIGDNPIPWKERHVEGLAPITALRRVPTWLAVLLVLVLTTASGLLILATWARFATPTPTPWVELLRLALHGQFEQLLTALAPPPGTPPPTGAFFLQGVIVMLIASMVVGIRCSGAVTSEREKQAWEALLLTPLTVRHLIRGKVWGIIGASYIYLLAYLIPALLLATVGGFGCVFWVGVWAAVTWLATYFIGAVGIWASVRSRSSWRSLLTTGFVGYGGGALLFTLTSPILLMLAFFVAIGLTILDAYFFNTGAGMSALNNFDNYFLPGFQVATCLTLAGLFWGLGWYLLNDAQKWVADRERTRHWRDEPKRPKLTRRPVAQRPYR
jgi:ABC-type Na+ efflux pump permease subunit